MHPPLDRPHPDCQNAIAALRSCHDDWIRKFTGGCNEAKLALDDCFKAEKARLLVELDRDLPARRARQENIIKTAFGKEETFSEYLKKDQEFLRELEKAKSRRGDEYQQ